MLMVMDTQQFQEVREAEKDVNPVIHIVKLYCNRSFLIDLSNRPTGGKKKQKKLVKKTLFFILIVNQHFLVGTAEEKYIGDIRLEGPESENVMKLSCKHTEVYVLLLEVTRLDE